MILATAHFRFADLAFALDLDLDGLDLDADPAFAFALKAVLGLALPDLLRLPSTERPPLIIMSA
jgi:hypothetical protein